MLAESLTADVLTFGCSRVFSELAMLVMRENHFEFATSKDEAELLYLELVRKLHR